VRRQGAPFLHHVRGPYCPFRAAGSVASGVRQDFLHVVFSVQPIYTPAWEPDMA
jgi:hypothetical protein